MQRFGEPVEKPLLHVPVRKYSTEWWSKTWSSVEVHTLVGNSISIAVLVTLISVTLAFFGALAFARYDWKGRTLYQKLLLLPIFFPKRYWGWHCCCG